MFLNPKPFFEYNNKWSNSFYFNRWLKDQSLLAMLPEERNKKRAMESVVRSLRSSM